MLERLKHMLIKELLQALRNPMTKGILFVMPMVQLVVFGYAASTDVRDIPTAVCDLDNSPTSRDLVYRFERSGYFRIVERVAGERRVGELLDRGEARAVLRLDAGFGADVLAGRGAQLQMLIDGTDSMTAAVVMAYGQGLLGQFAEERAGLWAARHAGAARAPGGVELVSRAWFNENLESRPFYVPGVFALLIGLMTLLLTSMAVVREKELGTIEQIMVSPIRPVEFILGKTLPFALISFADVLLVLAVGVLWFEIPVRGSVALLFLCMALYVMAMLGVGLLISTVSRTQQQAMVTGFFFFMPAMLLSGFVFPIANMPEIIQVLTYVDPMRYLITIVRGIFLKGVGAGILWPQMLALAVLGVGTLWLGAARFRKTLA